MKSLPKAGPPPQKRSSSVVQEKLARAVSLHQQGKLAEAGALYDEILKSNRTNFDALHLLGLIHHQTKNSLEAERLMSKAIRLNPAVAAFHCNYGIVQQALGRFDDALQSYDRAVALKPDYAEAYLNRGIVLHDLGRFEEALGSYDRAIALKPDLAEAHSNRGSTLQELARFDEAVAGFDRAVKLKPDYAEAWYNRGNALQKLERFDDALASYDRATAIKPNFAEAHSNRGTTLKELRRFDDALVAYNCAIALKPDYIEAHSNRGATLKELKRFDEAIASIDRAIALDPAFAQAHINRGHALQEHRRFDEARASYERAIEAAPELAEAYWNLSTLSLLRGDYQTGWCLFEWRWKTRNYIGRPLVTSRPRWDGGGQKRVLVTSEQGVGDEIMFSALLADMQKTCSRTIARVDARLIPLLARSMPGDIAFVSNDTIVDENDYDEHVPMGSLCGYFRPNEASFGATRGGYLVADRVRTESIRAALKQALPSNKKICGISWRSSNKNTGPDRSLDLKACVEMLALDNIDFVSLQYGDTAAEIEQVRSELGVNVLSYQDVDNFSDIDGLASLIQACDVVVSVDNTTVHLAGALGKDTRVLLPYVVDWRWLLDRSDSPWYASLRLYRQDGDWNWPRVFEALRADLSRL